MRGTVKILATCVLLGAGAFWGLTRPASVSDDFGAGLVADAQAGAEVFAAGGCASCHAAPAATDDAKLVLAGGEPFASDFGTFYAPNISPDPDHGIGGWSLNQFARAVTKGVSPGGQHYYPAFPYTAYQHMTAQDVVNLHAYMQTLPKADVASVAHNVGFPFNIRRGLGLWKTLFARGAYVLQGDQPDSVIRGRYLVEGLAHCGECHTPRNALGGLDRSAWLSGAPNPSGKGRIPGITPAQLKWSEAELLEYLTSGFTPEYDSAGGKMADVVTNLAKLPESDRAAIVAYLQALPASR